MPVTHACPKCDAPLDANATAGLCPACVMEQMADDLFAADDAVPADHEFPGYTDVEKIGEGGMSHVFKARHEILGRWVAIKIPSASIANNPEFQERFLREAKAMANLHHPNIVPIYEFGSTGGGQPFFTMELVEGVSLRELIRGKMNSDQILKVAVQICDALQHAHQHGLVHRDIKPGNILVTPEGTVKVADFGLSKADFLPDDELSLTMTDVSMGTPNYMAPEQRDSTRDVDLRADIYALGVMLYEMITGELPQGAYQKPSELSGNLGANVDVLVEKALQRDPEKRFGNATEIKSQLENASRKWLNSSRSPGTTKRRKLLVGAACLSILAAAALAFYPKTDPTPAQPELPETKPDTLRLISFVKEEGERRKGDFRNAPWDSPLVTIKRGGTYGWNRTWYAGLTNDNDLLVWGPATKTKPLKNLPSSILDIVDFELSNDYLVTLDTDGNLTRLPEEKVVPAAGGRVRSFAVTEELLATIDKKGKVAIRDLDDLELSDKIPFPENFTGLEFTAVHSGQTSFLFIEKSGRLFYYGQGRLDDSGKIESLPVSVSGIHRHFLLTMPDGTLRSLRNAKLASVPDPVLGEISDAKSSIVRRGQFTDHLFVQRSGGGWYAFETDRSAGFSSLLRMQGIEAQLQGATDVVVSEDHLFAIHAGR